MHRLYAFKSFHSLSYKLCFYKALYIPIQITTINCARLILSNEPATNGLVSVIEKVSYLHVISVLVPCSPPLLTECDGNLIYCINDGNIIYCVNDGDIIYCVADCDIIYCVNDGDNLYCIDDCDIIYCVADGDIIYCVDNCDIIYCVNDGDIIYCFNDGDIYILFR